MCLLNPQKGSWVFSLHREIHYRGSLYRGLSVWQAFLWRFSSSINLLFLNCVFSWTHKGTDKKKGRSLIAVELPALFAAYYYMYGIVLQKNNN